MQAVQTELPDISEVNNDQLARMVSRIGEQIILRHEHDPINEYQAGLISAECHRLIRRAKEFSK